MFSIEVASAKPQNNLSNIPILKEEEEGEEGYNCTVGSILFCHQPHTSVWGLEMKCSFFGCAKVAK